MGDMSIQEDVEALKRIPLFAKVEPAKLKLMAFASERAQYQTGDLLFNQGDTADAAYIILEGAADILVATPDGPLKVADVGPGAFVGEIAILMDVPRTASIKATEPMTTLKITKELFFRMVTDFPSIGLEVMRVLAQRIENMNVQLREAVAARK
jgi:CRP-like cAMP-binding protein